jgi:Sulfotransferase family
VHQPLIIFSHIPKTGGLTLRSIIDRQYRPDQIYRYPAHQYQEALKKLSTVQREKIRCIYGHCRFGIHRYFHRPFRYITLLRDPVNRVISAYYYIKSSPNNKLYTKANRLSFEEFILSKDDNIRLPLWNHQTRFLSGKHHPDLEQAKRNLSKHYAVVGITEMYPHSVFLMKRALGWSDIDYTKQNVTKRRPHKQQVPEELIRIIKQNNALDIQLYHFAKRLLIRRINNLPPTAKRQLAQYVKRHQQA